MRNSVLIFLAGVTIGSSCSSGPPRQLRHDAVLTGEQTAAKAGDAAREAAKNDNTGLIYASSNSPAPEPEPTAPAAEDGTAEAPRNLVTVTIAADGLTLGGKASTEEEVITQLTARLQEDPDLIVVLVPAAEGVPPERTAALEARIREAGVKNVQEPAKSEKPEEAPVAPEAPIEATPPADPAK